MVNVASSQVLNADVKTPLSSVLGVTPGLLRSDEDTDPELVVVVNFSEAVRLRSIKFVATEARTEGDVDASGPRTVKIFRDKPNYTFSDCASETPTETLQLTAKQIAGTEEISLKLAKFTSLHSLTIFVENNQDDTREWGWGGGYSVRANLPRSVLRPNAPHSSSACLLVSLNLHPL